METLDALALAQALIDARNKARAVASVKSLRGASAGLHVLVFDDGTVRGSLGDPALDDAARQLGLACLHSTQPQLQDVPGGAQLFGEPHLPADRLIIVGAGHIAVPLAQVAVMIGFTVIVLDDREDFATEERFPDAALVQRMDLQHPFQQIPLDSRSYVVLVTRAHKYDFDCLRELLSQSGQARYIGMIGSKRRVRAAFHALLEGGFTQEQLAQVRAPLGLDIGAETPAEIAISIAAELIRERSGTGTYVPLAAHERVLERFFANQETDDAS